MAAIDANIFYDLTCHDRPQGNDTRALLADWLQESIELCIAPEIYNEIHRCTDETEKKRTRAAAQGFRELTVEDNHLRRIECELKLWFNAAANNRDLSDLRQVAYAICAEVPFLITRDAAVLGQTEGVFEKYGLRILHPTDLINHLDLLRREAEYRPVRLEGSRWRMRLVAADDVDAIVRQFRHPSKERVRDFERSVRHYLALPNEWKSRLVLDDAGSAAIYLVQGVLKAQHVEIPILRNSGHPLAGTLLRHLLHTLGNDDPTVGVRTVAVTDVELGEEPASALSELGFVSDGKSWWKLSLTGVFPRTELRSLIEGVGLPQIVRERLTKSELLEPQVFEQRHCFQIEHSFSPVKIVAPDVSCFVVSIRPEWAAHFFDIPAGGQTLMDLNERLHLGIEGAYYCAPKNVHVKAPGRILWYVSKGPRGGGAMSIRACSYLAETTTGTPKEIFARFRHLGVYAWKHVLATAGTLDKKVMALRFTRTERFVREVPFSECIKLGIPQPINPRRISDDQFGSVYRMGMAI